MQKVTPQPLTRKQYDVKVQQLWVRNAIRITQPLGPLKQFAVVQVAQAPTANLRAAILWDVTQPIKDSLQPIMMGCNKSAFKLSTQAPAADKHTATDPDAWLASENTIFARFQMQLDAPQLPTAPTATTVDHEMTTAAPEASATGA
ncbi:hypothetical protein HDU84_008672, partial [Entophlyctis sp. JEL0112]